MKSLTLLALILPAGLVLAESAIPEPYPKERYTDTLSQSPFVLATPVDDKEAKPASLLDNLILTGMGKVDDGRDYVIVQRIGDEGSMKFIGNEPNDQGISVKEVKWADRWNNSSAVLKYGSLQETVKFKDNPAPAVAMAPPPGANTGRPPGIVNAPVAPNASGGAPGPRPPTVGGPRSASSITPTIPRPGTPQVPRPGGGVPLPSGNNNFRGGGPQLTQGGAQPANQPSPNGGSGRIRTRSINNR